MRIGSGARINAGISTTPRVPWWGSTLTPKSAYIIHPAEFTDVTQWGDDTTNNLMLQSSDASSIPTYNATGVAGGPSIELINGRNLQGLNAADWTHLHSGEYSIGWRGHCNSALNSQCVFSTALSSANGCLLMFDGTAGRFWFVECGPSGFILSAMSAGGLVSPGNDYSVVVRVSRSGGAPNCSLYLDGALIQTANYSGASTVGNPARPLTLARFQNAAAHWYGKVRSFLTFDYDIGSSNVAELFTILSSARSHRATRYFRFYGDSITEGAQSHRRQIWTRFNLDHRFKPVFLGDRPPGGNFPLADKRHDGFSGQTINQIGVRLNATVRTVETDIVHLVGTNSVAAGVPAALADLDTYLDDALAKFPPPCRHWVFELPYGTGSGAITEGAEAGAYNAALDGVIATKGPWVRKIALYAAGGALPPYYDVATCAIDAAGHQSPAGGVFMGDKAADTMGI